MSATKSLLSRSEKAVIEAQMPRSNYNSINDDPHQPLIAPSPTDEVLHRPVTSTDASGSETRVYKRRWYVMILYSVMAGTQGGVWNTFGPISSTAEDAFGWDDSDISWLTNWGPIGFIIGIVPLVWLVERKGLRAAGLSAALLVALGTVARIFTMEPPAVTIMMNVGQALNGIAGPVAMAGPPAVSAVWFPPSQRTTATAIGVFFAMFGTAAGFVIGPMLVPDVPKNSSNSSHLQDIDFMGDFLAHNQSKAERIASERKAIQHLMYIECGWACAIFIAMLIYFPKKPPLPPSTSASIQRVDFVAGIKNIMGIPQFWIIGMVYAVSQGVLNCWSSLLNVILKPHGITETEAGWIGFAAVCGGCLMSILIAVLADYMKRVMKWFVMLFYVMGTVCFLIFALTVQGLISPSTALFSSTIILGTSVVYAATPLIFEMACELSYPTGEGTANGVFTLLNNICGAVFLLVMLVPGLGTMWMNWVVMGTCVASIPLLVFVKVQYNRLDLDEHNPSLNAKIFVEPTPYQQINSC